MAYFLKKTTLKKRTYLSIVDSHYDPERKHGAHTCYKSLGSVETLRENGMEDPVAFYQKEVDELNQKRIDTSADKISSETIQRNLGYFILRAVMTKLDVKKDIDLFRYAVDFEFDLFTMLSSLVYARVVCPCSKYKTFYDVLPTLFENCIFSYDQLLDGVEYFGKQYEKIIELFTSATNEKYGLDTSRGYFDCTNFYFEIDREDLFRMKGPSKENSTGPIVGLGLLLDAQLIPIGMRLYPGNQSEKPVLREVIESLKKRNNITGKTVQVADKGLNCAENIFSAIENNDGYIFSKSVKTLPETEKTWVLLDNGWTDVCDSEGNLIYRYKSCIDDFEYSITDIYGKKRKVALKEKRLLTYNPSLARKQKVEIKKQADKAANTTYSSAKKNEYGDRGKYMNFVSEDGEKATAVINQDAIDKDLLFAGYNLIVTSEIEMKDRDIYDTYHNLWRIEESFRTMKSFLDARPVYVQKKDTIIGHFLICYLSVLLIRLVQFKELENKHCTEEIVEFIQKLKLVKVSDSQYMNISTKTDMITEIANYYNIPIENLKLTSTQLKKVLNLKL